MTAKIRIMYGYVTVPSRNSRHVFQSITSLHSQHCTAKLLLRVGLNIARIYTVHMKPALKGIPTIWHFECGDVIEVRDGIIHRTSTYVSILYFCD